MNKLLSINVAVPVISKTLNLVVPPSMLSSVLEMTVKEMVGEMFQLSGTGNLFLASSGCMLDDRSTVGELPTPQGLKLVLM